MITQITLHNWQNHKFRVFDLDQVNVIVGDNGHGKSALLRALKWVILNEWDGKSGEYITHGEEECKVSICVDKRNVGRTRGKDTNSYFLDKKTYRAFGTTVPNEIARFLNISAASFQDQDDPAFWLSLSTGKAASALNEIFHLEEIDNSLSRVNSELRLARTRYQVSKERLQQAKEERDKLDWVEDADQELKQIEQLQDKIKGNSKELQRLTAIWKSVCREGKRLSRLQECVEIGNSILSVLEKLENLKLKDSKLRKVVKLQGDILCQTKNLKVKENQLKEFLKGKCPLCNRGD